jgi:hypothetical protein
MKKKINFLYGIVVYLLNYPLHFLLGYLWAKIFGTLKLKIKYDVFRLPHYAFGVYEAALRAHNLGIKEITVVEFGVANGRGLIAMAKYSEKIMQALNIKIQVIGFDSGAGMPKHEGYKDHPELYLEGDFPMQNFENLKKILPSNTKLIITNLNADNWTKYISNNSPIGFVSIDVDYYSSTINLLNYLFTIEVEKLLPNSLFYLDDVTLDNHNPYQGELLALNEFNKKSELRKFDSYFSKLRQKQKFYNSPWLSQIYQLHCFDHPVRNAAYRKEDEAVRILSNKYLKL